MSNFRLISSSGRARAGELKTAHSVVKTPAFMPVATKASVKTLSSEELQDIGVEMIISNAFHLYMRPGLDVIKRAGGLHNFMNWQGSIFTDSGGFQMIREFSMKVREEGVEFRNPYNGNKELLTPENVCEIQEAVGADVAMVLDECPPWNSEFEYAKNSAGVTYRWAKRFRDAHTRKEQMVFGICQGAVHDELRRESAKELASLDLDGYGIGGLCIGESKEDTRRSVTSSLSCLPEEKPRYLMGVGAPSDVLDAIEMGVDIFDSVFPTRNARHRSVLTFGGKYNLGKTKHALDSAPLEEGCWCAACKNYSRGYINHLIREEEMLGMRLVSIHNIFFLERLVREARQAIVENAFERYRKETLARLGAHADAGIAKATQE